MIGRRIVSLLDAPMPAWLCVAAGYAFAAVIALLVLLVSSLFAEGYW